MVALAVRDRSLRRTKACISTNANAAPVSKASSKLAGASLLVELNMSRENAARRNRALQKVRKSKHLTPEIKEAIQVVIDLLNSKSDYVVAWPSANTIALRMGRSRRSGLHYVKVIKALGIFRWKSLSPEDATKYCERNFGVRLKLERCGGQAPNLFSVNESHPLWNSQRELPKDVDHQMGEIARSIKAARNEKTTSRLSSDPDRRPRRRRYSLHKMREALSRTLKRLRNDVANEDVLRLEEAERWCREDAANDVANDITDGVANDTQVFRRSSSEDDGAVTSQDARQEQPASAPLGDCLTKRVLPTGSPLLALVRADTPPARQFRDEYPAKSRSELGSDGESIALAESECRSASAALVGSGFAALTKSRSTVPVRHRMSEQGGGRIDGELLATMERLEDERRKKEQRLSVAYANRPDADILDSVSLAVRCPSFATGRTQGRP